MHDVAAIPVGSQPCQCELPRHAPKLVAVTGGPGAGKTAVLEMARRSFCRHIAILPEAAGIVFGGGFPRLGSPAARCAAQRAIFHVQRELEVLVAEEQNIAVALCDRGVIDGIAYWPKSTASYWQEVGTRPEVELQRYAAVVHLRTPGSAQGFDNSNPLRVESAEQAAVLDARIAEAWSAHPRRVEVPRMTDFLEKARVVLGLVRAELPACCHLHDIDLPKTK